MSEPTDFDLLTSPASPAESRRLYKLLGEWGAGDENSFPVQLTLLTRAQWRAAASVKADFGAQRKALTDQGEKFQADFVSLTRSAEIQLKSHSDRLQVGLSEQVSAMKTAAASARSGLAETESLAKAIQQSLREGHQAWTQVKAEFEAERTKLREERVRLEQTTTRDIWIGFGCLVGVSLFLGVVIGVYLVDQRVVQFRVSAPPPGTVQGR